MRTLADDLASAEQAESDAVAMAIRRGLLDWEPELRLDAEFGEEES